MKLTRSLSQEELYILIKDMDVDERAEVLKFAAPSQLLFITDMDCWKGDRIDDKSLTCWLESLLRAGPKVLMSWLRDLDYETLVAGLKKIITVVKPEREYAVDEILGDVPCFTLDDNYFIAVQSQDLEIVRQVFQVLFENHRGRYIAIMEGVLSEIDDQIEDEAYCVREARLAARGFPDPESAWRIYRPLTREEFDQLPGRPSEAARAGNDAPI